MLVVVIMLVSDSLTDVKDSKCQTDVQFDEDFRIAIIVLSYVTSDEIIKCLRPRKSFKAIESRR